VTEQAADLQVTARCFPSEFEAPFEILDLDSGCGILSMWQVLEHFGQASDAAELIRVTRFDPDVGAYAIAIAVALADLGLSVAFHTETDPDPAPVEREFYREAAARGIIPQPALSAMELGLRLEEGAVAIVLYEALDGATYGHFTPVLAIGGDVVDAPNESGFCTTDFEARWRRPGILRQCVIVSEGRKTADGAELRRTP